MNEITEFGAENNALARRYGSQSPLVFTMASDAFPVIPANFGGIDPELLAIRGDAMRASCGQAVAAVAARFSAGGLANPLSSGVIAVVESIAVMAGAAGPIRVYKQGLAVSALQGSVQGYPMDSRQSERASVRMLLTDEAALANYGDFVYYAKIPAVNTLLQLASVPYVLTPGSTLWVVNGTANTALDVSFTWRQRRIVSQEASS